jgi:hypothetical protein
LRLLHGEHREIEFGRIGRRGRRARTVPGSEVEAISTGSEPLTGKRTRVPSRLISSAVARWQISVASWPAAATLVANSEP